jgi:hypothetical protein
LPKDGAVPKGTYHHLDDHSGELVAVETFSCAPGPQGWRYVGDLADPDGAPLGRVDVTVDSRWRQLRVEVRAGSWVIRGGTTGAEVVYVRLPAGELAPGEEQQAAAVAFTGRSPAFAITTSRLLGLELLDKRRLTLLQVTEPSAGTRIVEQGWALVDVTEHESETGPLVVRRYEVADLATGDRQVWSIAGDVVVEGPHLELVDLASPPNQ